MIALGGAFVVAPAHARQQATSYGYDALGRLTTVARPHISETRYAYDAAGNRISVTVRELGASTSASGDFGGAHGYGDQIGFQRLLGDVNGDGRQDMIAVGGSAVFVALAQPDGAFAPTITATTQVSRAAGWTNADRNPIAAGDVDGDGRADLVMFADDAVYIARGQANGTFGPKTKAIDGYGAVVGGWNSQDAVPRLVGDVNGDGRADIVGLAYGSVQVSLGRADGTFAPPIQATLEMTYNNSWVSMNRYPRMLADVNGDGRVDLVGFATDVVQVALGRADGTFAPAIRTIAEFGESAGGWTTYDVYPRFVSDINADGRADIIGFGADYVVVAFGQADGSFAQASSWASPFASAWGLQNARPRLVGDTDGDHRADLLAIDNDGVHRQAGRL